MINFMMFTSGVPKKILELSERPLSCVDICSREVLGFMNVAKNIQSTYCLAGTCSHPRRIWPTWIIVTIIVTSTLRLYLLVCQQNIYFAAGYTLYITLGSDILWINILAWSGKPAWLPKKFRVHLAKNGGELLSCCRQMYTLDLKCLNSPYHIISISPIFE